VQHHLLHLQRTPQRVRRSRGHLLLWRSFWIKQRGRLPGLLCFSNELISRDEGLHCDFACLLHNRLVCPASPSYISTIIRDAVDIEHEFVRDAIPFSLLGMNAGSMRKYIEFCAGRLVVVLEQPRIYGTPNPFPWMTLISLQGKNNFKGCR
jgi:ribonucleotide reductase beta subunit family protein with ferritin-like domain